MLNLSFCTNQSIGTQIYEPSQSSLSYVPSRSQPQLSCAPNINSSLLGNQYPQYDESTLIYPLKQQQNQQCISNNNIQFNYKNPNYVSTTHQINSYGTNNDGNCHFQQPQVHAHPLPRPSSISSPNSSPGPIISTVNMNENFVTLNNLQNYSQPLKVTSLPQNNNNNNQTPQNYQTQLQPHHLYPNYSSIVAALATSSVESKAPWTADEDETLTKMYEQIGPQWARISEVLPGRTISQIRSRRNAIESRKRQRQKAAMKQLKLAPELKQRIEQRKQLYDQKYDSRNSTESSSPIYNSCIAPYNAPLKDNPQNIGTNVSSNINISTSTSSPTKGCQNEHFYCSIESLLN